MYQYIEICGHEMSSFSLCIGGGLALGVILIFVQLKRMDISLEKENSVMISIPITFIFGVACGYLADLLLRGGFKAVFINPFGYGLTFYGWLIGAIFFLLIYAKCQGISALFILNLFLPTFSIAQSVGRIGCFLGGCCYGRPYKWGICYPVGSFPYNHYGSKSLFPVQLLESGYLLIVFIILFLLIKFKNRAGWYLILMPIGRFFLEFFRGDDRGEICGDKLSPSQWMSIGFLIAGIYLVLREKNKEKEDQNGRREFF